MADDRRIAFMSAGYNPTTRTFTDFLGDLNKESDRGAVLISAAFLDDQLKEVIEAFVVEDSFKGLSRPLNSFSTVVSIAFALGLISKEEADECATIQKDRNKFGHMVKMSFDDSEVKSLCGNLHFAVGPVAGVPPDARMQFTSAAVDLISKLLNRAKHAQSSRLQYRKWPT